MKKVSTNLIYIKKYFISWFSILLLYIFFRIIGINSGIIFYLVWTFTISYSLVCLRLRKVEFDNEFIYFDKKSFKYNSISNFKTFEFNRNYFVLFILKDEKIKDRFQFSQLELFNISDLKSLKSIITNKEFPKDNTFIEFINNLKEKSNIKKLDW
jgi:hypothetical protein